MKKNATCPHPENTEENLISISSPLGERMEVRGIHLKSYSPSPLPSPASGRGRFMTFPSSRRGSEGDVALTMITRIFKNPLLSEL